MHKRRPSREEAGDEVLFRCAENAPQRRHEKTRRVSIYGSRRKATRAALPRASRQWKRTTYAALSAFATKNAKNELGPHAALALGYYDLSRDKPDLALGWLRKAVDDKLLREYVQYWQAQASLALGQKEEALEQLQSFRRDFPDSVMTEQAVTSLAQTALAIGKGEVARRGARSLSEYGIQSPLCCCCGRKRGKRWRRRKAKSPWPRPRIISISIIAFR